MVPVTENYAIDGDDICITVYKKRAATAEKPETYISNAYYPNLEQAMKAISQREIAIETLSNGNTDIANVIDLLKELNKKIEDIILSVVKTLPPDRLKQAVVMAPEPRSTSFKQKVDTKQKPAKKRSAKPKETVATYTGNAKKKLKDSTEYTKDMLEIENV